MVVDVTSLPAAERNLGHVGFQFATGFSHQAVMVFFVLSGFFVGGVALLEVQRTRTLDFGAFFTKRLVRLWLVIIPVLIVGSAFDYLGSHVFLGAVSGVYSPAALAKLELGTLVCNVAFLQTFACGQFGTNGALWSLANEFWYYVLFALLAFSIFANRPVVHRLAAAGLAVSLAAWLTAIQFDGSPLIPYFSIWLLGAWASVRRAPLVTKSVLVNAAAVVTFLFVFRVLGNNEVVPPHSTREFAADLVLGMLFANLVVAMKTSSRLARVPLRSLNVYLAGFSFSLYCLHTPLLHLYGAVALWFGRDAWKTSLVGLDDWAILVGALAVPVLSALVFAKATEHRTNAVRRAISLRIAGGAPV